MSTSVGLAVRCASVMAQGVDELALGHPRASGDADSTRLVEQFVLRALVVVTAAATTASDLAATLLRRGVGDAGRLPLAHALVAECLVLLRVLHRGPVLVSWHLASSLRARCTRDTPCVQRANARRRCASRMRRVSADRRGAPAPCSVPVRPGGGAATRWSARRAIRR